MAKIKQRLFKNHLTILETPEIVIFSYILPGRLYFINGADGMGFYPDMHGYGYIEWDIDLDIPQKNDYTWEQIRVLGFLGFKWKQKYAANSTLRNKIDFGSCVLNLNYAVQFAKNKEFMILNQNTANKYAAKYPEIRLTQFIADTVKQFCK